MLVDKGLDRSQTTVQIQRGDDGLDAVRQQGRLLPPSASFLSSPQPQITSQVERRGHLRQMAPADQAGAEAGPLSFMKIGKTTEEDFCHHQAQNRVSQKLQLLVVFFARRIASLRLRPSRVCSYASELWVSAFTSSCCSRKV